MDSDSESEMPAAGEAVLGEVDVGELREIDELGGDTALQLFVDL